MGGFHASAAALPLKSVLLFLTNPTHHACFDNGLYEWHSVHIAVGREPKILRPHVRICPAVHNVPSRYGVVHDLGYVWLRRWKALNPSLLTASRWHLLLSTVP